MLLYYYYLVSRLLRNPLQSVRVCHIYLMFSVVVLVFYHPASTDFKWVFLVTVPLFSRGTRQSLKDHLPLWYLPNKMEPIKEEDVSITVWLGAPIEERS